MMTVMTWQASRTAVVLRDERRQFRERVQPEPASPQRRVVALDEAPRAPAEEGGLHAGLQRRPDIVVDAVPHVQDPLGRPARRLDTAREELRRGLLDTPERRDPDDVDVQAERGE